MTKKHFIELADSLKQERKHWETQYGPEAFQSLVSFCVGFCRSQNYRFKTDVFRGYVNGDCGPCGVTVRKEGGSK